MNKQGGHTGSPLHMKGCESYEEQRKTITLAFDVVSLGLNFLTISHKPSILNLRAKRGRRLESEVF